MQRDLFTEYTSFLNLYHGVHNTRAREINYFLFIFPEMVSILKIDLKMKIVCQDITATNKLMSRRTINWSPKKTQAEEIS